MSSCNRDFFLLSRGLENIIAVCWVPLTTSTLNAQKCARSSSMRGCSRVLVVTELVSGTERTSLSYYPHKILYISLNNNNKNAFQ